MKKCNKCKIEKPLDEFPIRSGTVRRGVCRPCRYAQQDVYAKSDAGRASSRKRTATYRATEAGADAVAEYRKAYAQRAAERHAERSATDPEYVEGRRAYSKRWKASEHGRALGRAHRHARRARIAAAVPQRWRKSETPESLCYWCGCDLSETVTHIEHLMPIALGGPAEAYNEAPACEACNLAKSDTHPLVWLARQF